MDLKNKKTLPLLLVSMFLLATAIGMPVVASTQSPNDVVVEPTVATVATTVEPMGPLSTPYCGPIDLTIVLDDTGSMGGYIGGAINNIKAELPTIIATALAASGGDLRVGYMTFKDDITVHNQLTTNLAAVNASILATGASGGVGGPEASDEAKNTAVNNLPGGLRDDSAGHEGTQNGDYTTPYRDDALKLVVLITDAPPGGFNDYQDAADNASLSTVHANTAKSKGILVSDIFVPTGGDYAGQAALLKSDADITGGVYIMTASDGSGTGEAITAIIEACGGIPVTADKTVDPAAIPCDGSTEVTLTLNGQTGLSGDPEDIMLVLDRSGSMDIPPTHSELAQLKIAAKTFVDIIDEATDGELDGVISEGSRMGVVSFSSSATLDQSLTTDANAVKAAINALVAIGQTNHAAAIQAAQDELAGSEPDNTKDMIIFTDGNSVPSSAHGQAEAAAARAAGTEIFAIGLGDSIDVSQLNGWATDPDSEHVYLAPDADDLQEIFEEIGAVIIQPAGTNIEVLDTVNNHFGISDVVASKGTVEIIGNVINWTIDKLMTETVTLTYTATHDNTMPGGVEAVNDDVTYIDDEGNVVVFPDPEVFVDCQAPEVTCEETVNPAGKNVPKAGKTRPNSQGENQDGFYMVGAEDDYGLLLINIVDLGTDNVLDTGDDYVWPFDLPLIKVVEGKIKYTEANGATPSMKPMGGPESAIDAHVNGQGDAAIVAVDWAGNVGVAYCLVPPPPM